MYCPRCGQHFVSDVRFCSRCGLQMNIIAEIVANQAFVIPAETGAALRRQSPRRQGMRLGGQLMFAGLALTPVFFGLCFLVDGPGPLFIPSILFFAGLCWLLYSRIFGDDSLIACPSNSLIKFGTAKPAASFISMPDRSRLGHHDQRRVNTAEVVESPNVTDHTTQFFEQ